MKSNSTPNSSGKEREFIYVRYITKNGKRIYPKNAKVFKIPVSNLKDRKVN